MSSEKGRQILHEAKPKDCCKEGAGDLISKQNWLYHENNNGPTEKGLNSRKNRQNQGEIGELEAQAEEISQNASVT